MAFRCDRPKPFPGSVPRQDVGGQAGGTGRLSFVVHQHRAALSGGDESFAGGAVPNSLSVQLEPDGEGGGQVSIRCRLVLVVRYSSVCADSRALDARRVYSSRNPLVVEACAHGGDHDLP